MDKETKRTLGRLAEWFGMMGFAVASDAMAAECLEHGDEVYFRRTRRVPTGADRFRMQRCWSPSRFLEDVKGFPQDQLRVALPYRAGVTEDMDDAARDRLWDATARGMACAARRRHVRRVRPLPLTDGLTVNGRGHSPGDARADFERHVTVLSWEATA